MGGVKRHSGSQVAAIKVLRESAMSQKDITLQMGCSQSAVSKILANKQSIRKNCGRKMKTTRRDKSTKEDHHLEPVSKLQRNLPTVESVWSQVSQSITLRRLHSLGYQSRFSLTKPFLNSKHKKETSGLGQSS